MLEVLLATAVILVSALGFGSLAAARLNLRPLEAFAAIPGLSCIGVYLLQILGAWAGANLSRLTLGLSLVALCLGGRGLIQLFSSRDVSAAAAGFLLVLSTALAADALIRSYSGGGWAVDWYEHYDRTTYWLAPSAGEPPRFGNSSHVTARPPFMNILCAYVMQFTGRSFYIFEFASTCFNSMAFLAAALLAHGYFAEGVALKNRGQGAANTIPLLVALFALSPIVLQNMTYSWTKLLSVYFVLLGLYFYLDGAAQSLTRSVLAWVFLAAGVLVHYSAAIYFVILAIHFAGRLLGRKMKAGEFVGAAWGAGPLLLTWIGWSLWRFGPAITFGSNTSVGERGSHTTWGIWRDIGTNLITTTVPYFFRRPVQGFFSEGSLDGLRDRFFFLYQTNALFTLGCMGLPALVWLIWRHRRARGAPLFWIYFVVGSYLLAVALHGSLEHFGVFHVSSQALTLLGLAFLAANYPLLAPLVRLVALLGIFVDVVFGIVLHVYIQALNLMGGGGDGQSFDLTQGYTDLVVGNWRVKTGAGYQFLADIVPEWWVWPGWVLFIAILVYAFRQLWRFTRMA